MPIPATRSDLQALVTSSYEKLQRELDRVSAAQTGLPCIDQWSIKELLAVRAWWTESVVDWIEAGRRGESPTTPAPGYGWRDTPRLNSDIVRKSKTQTYRHIIQRLERGYQRVLSTIDELSDTELLEPGVFSWAGKWPVARWISINTARQYTTARTLIRRALKQQHSP